MAAPSPNVLIVDNCRLFHLVVAKVLTTCGVRVTLAHGPEQALLYLDEENDVDLILTDYYMFNMTGYDLLMEVKESRKLKHLPVVFTSTEAPLDIIEKCMEGGAKDFMLKPIRVSDVPRLLSHI